MVIKFTKFLPNFTCKYRFLSLNRAFDIMPEYNLETKKSIDSYWHEKNCEINVDKTKPKFYILSMFPYPSGQLHLGHMRVYTTADALVRFNILNQKNVIFPMGWDSFGLPAENAAIERNLPPREWTLKNISEMKKQMTTQMTLAIDWNRELSTCDAEYFKWTQWIFCELYRKGFAYRRSDRVNWDPVDQTVLADELVDANGFSWRSGAKVEQKILRQWWLRTSAFTEELLDGLDYLKHQGGIWRSVINKQEGWLGKPNGVNVEMDLIDIRDVCHASKERMGVFTNYPGLVLSGLTSFIEISRDNIWWDDNVMKKNPNNHLQIHPYLVVRHPISGRYLPIVLNSQLKFSEESSLTAKFGFPSINTDDYKVAMKFKLPNCIKLGIYDRVVESKWDKVKPGEQVHWLENWKWKESTEELQRMGRGGWPCNYQRKDWLVSRQRRWGTSIPILHCELCGAETVATNDQLPVLPDEGLNKGEKCHKCGNTSPETLKWDSDTMDTFMDSSWYYLKYLDSSATRDSTHDSITSSLPNLSKDIIKGMPVDIYVGGEEHAIRHLFYARFINHFLYKYTELYGDKSDKNTENRLDEPFSQFLPIGLVLGETLQIKSTGKYVKSEDVEFKEAESEKAANQNIVGVHKETGEPVCLQWEKMSKSKHNGVSPESIVNKFGIDSTRLILLSNTGPDKDRKWKDYGDVVIGALKWESKYWELIRQTVDSPISVQTPDQDVLWSNDEFLKQYSNCVEKSVQVYESAFTISVIIARIHGITNFLRKLLKKHLKSDEDSSCELNESIYYNRTLLDITVLLYPVCPLFSSELWSQLASKLHASQQIFIDSSDIYADKLGVWKYDLSKPVWEQDITGIRDCHLSRLKKKQYSRIRQQNS